MKKILVVVFLSLPMLGYSQYKVASSMTSGKKQITTTQYDEGYVILNTGETINGKIQLKIVNTDTTEIRMKLADKSKKKYSRYDVSEFGLANKSGAQLAGKEKKNPTKNLQPGYVLLPSGDKKEGKVAMRNSEEQINQAFAKSFVIFEDADGVATKYLPEDLDWASQTIDGEEVLHYSYKSVFVEVIGDGALRYMRNPFPTTVNGVATAVAQSAAKDAKDEIAVQSLKSGASLEDVEEFHGSVNESEIKIYFKEYLVIRKGSSNPEIVTKKNYKSWAPSGFAGCNMDKGITKYNKIEEALAYYNKNCGS